MDRLINGDSQMKAVTSLNTVMYIHILYINVYHYLWIPMLSEDERITNNSLNWQTNRSTEETGRKSDRLDR